MRPPGTPRIRTARDALSFGALADAYERGRPTYPAEAVDWLVPPGVRRVLDLGCGTGKLTEALVGRGLDVVAVDPLDEMLARLRAKLPNVPTDVGTAEAIPLPAASVDAVLMAQAWHWVDPTRAVPEVARVLRPGGTLGLVWNVRGAGLAWIVELNRVMDGGDPAPHFVGAPKVGPPFAPLQRHDVRWIKCLNEAELLDLAASRSYYAGLEHEAQVEVRKAVRSLFVRMPRTSADRSRVAVPYVTSCFRSRLASRA